MPRSEKAVVTALCMVYSGNRILLQNRVKEDWKGWTFPGGHIEKGESFVRGIQREIKEETGLTIADLRLCGVKQFQTEEEERYLVLLFKTDCFEGELTSSAEGEMFWVERERLAEYNLAADFMELLRVFDEEKLNEMQYERHEDGGKARWEIKLY